MMTELSLQSAGQALTSMTTLARDQRPGETLVLVCDECGNTLRAEDLPVRDFQLLWQAALDIGWVGAERTEGRHYCPACAEPDGAYRPA